LQEKTYNNMDNRRKDKQLIKLEKKLEQLSQLINMAKADRIFKKIEYKFLYEIALVMQVPIEKLEALLENKIEYNRLPSTREERIIQIYRLTLMMMVDGIITDEEMVLLKNYALEMKLHPESIEMMLKRIKSSKGGMLLPAQLQQIFAIQNN